MSRGELQHGEHAQSVSRPRQGLCRPREERIAIAASLYFKLRPLEKLGRDFRRGVVQNVYLVVEFPHDGVIELAGKLRECFLQSGNSLERLPANDDRDLIRRK